MYKLIIKRGLAIFCLLSVNAFGQVQNSSVCLGQSVSLNPSVNGDLYGWTSNPLDPSLLAINDKNPTVKPIITTKYTVTTLVRSGNNLVKNGDFEQGNRDFNSQYTYSSTNRGNGIYDILENSNQFYSAFDDGIDHTPSPGVKMLVADGSASAGAKVWIQTVTVDKNTDYAFSAWVVNVNSNTVGNVNGVLSTLRFSINNISIGQDLQSKSGRSNWQEFYVKWNSGNATTAEISISEGTGSREGNDFALDDIIFNKVTSSTETINVTVLSPVAVPIIAGENLVCLSNTINLTSSTSGGIWTTSDPLIATIDAFGKVTPIKVGKTNINYTQNDFCNTTSLPFEITVSALPQLDQIKGITKLTIGEQSILSINLPGGIWISSNPSIVEVKPNGTVKGISEGESLITYTIMTPCLANSLPFKISVIRIDDFYAPNGFTPNGDGNNDEFKIYGTLIDKMELTIYNQWGELIYKSTDQTKGWPGTYKGEEQPTGVYIFTIKLKMTNGKEVIRKGPINLIR